MAEFSREEILEVHDKLIAVRDRVVAGELPWGNLADFFTEDATFVDPAWGRYDGRENIRAFMEKSMQGLEGWEFPHEWEMVDGDRLVTGWQNRLPGRRPDGGYWQAPGLSRFIYAGDGKFSLEHDLLNMTHVFEIMKESGWKPSGPMNAPPKNPVRLCAWEPGGDVV